MSTTSIRVLGLAAALSLGAAHAFAEDPLPTPQSVVQKVQDNTYFPKASGMKDITVSIDNSMLAMLGGDVLIQYMWKSPDKEVIVVKGLEDNPMVPPDAVEQMKKQFKQVGRMCVGEGIQDRLKGYDLSIAKDGENLVVTGKTADPEQMYSELSFWVSAEHVIVKQKGKLTTPRQGQTESEQTYVLAKKDGKSYAVGSTQPDGTKATIEWADVSGIFMPIKMTIDSPRNPMGPMSLEFKDVKVNSGLDDAVFAAAPAPPAPATKPADEKKNP